MNLFKVSKIFSLLIITLALFSSCTKDEEFTRGFQNGNFTSPSLNPEGQEGNESEIEGILEFEDCLELVFPIKVIFPDESTATFSDLEELEDEIELWYESNPDATEDPAFDYPIEIVVDDGSPTTINNYEEFEAVLENCEEEEEEEEDCEGHEEEEECFVFIYPITLVLPDQSNSTVNDEEEFEERIDSWYENNPEVEEDPSLVFPVDVILDSEEQLTITSEEELEELYEGCEDDEDELEYLYELADCFDIVYPFTLILGEQSVVEISSEDQLEQVLLVWFENNPDLEELPTPSYPIEVVFDEEEVISISNDEELEEVLSLCEEFEDDFWIFEGECFEVEFPLTFSLPDGSEVSVNTFDEAEEAIFEFYESNPEAEGDIKLVFPLTIELEDGSLMDIASEEEWDAAEELCEE